MELGFNDLMQANPLLGPLEGVGSENIDFFAPSFRAHPFRQAPIDCFKILAIGPNLQSLRSPEIDFTANLCSLAESIPWAP
jgi:hypothetical protein